MRRERVNRDLRQEVADAEAARQVRVGNRLVERERVVGEVVAKLAEREPRTKEAGAEVGAESSERWSGEPRKDAGFLRRLVRAHASMETLMTALFGADSTAYRVTVENIRRGQEGYHDERRRFHQHMDEAFKAAGVPPGTKKLNDWMNRREDIDLPDAGRAALTRNEMVGLVAPAGDPETMALVERGATWNFRGRPRDEAMKLTPRDIAAIKAALTEGERKLIDAFKDYNRDQITPRAMAAKLELSGWAPEPHEGYYPRQRNLKHSDNAGLPEGWRSYRGRALENLSSMKERAADVGTPLFVPQFVEDTSKYLDDNALLVHLAEPVRTAASVWEHPQVVQQVARVPGESANRRMVEFLEDSMLVTVAPENTKTGRLVSMLTRNVSRSWLTMNPKTMAANVVGGTVSLIPEFELPDLAAGVRKMFSRQSYNEMVNASGVAWDRYEGRGLYGQYSPLTERRVESVANMTFVEAVKAGKLGAAVDALPFLPWADSVPLVVTWEARLSAASALHRCPCRPGSRSPFTHAVHCLSISVAGPTASSLKSNQPQESAAGPLLPTQKLSGCQPWGG